MKRQAGPRAVQHNSVAIPPRQVPGAEQQHKSNLPVQPTPLIGREKEMAAVQQLLLRQDVRLLTLTGPGGIGKTRLSLQIAAELSEMFLDGTFFVDLAPVRDPGFVVPAIAQALGVKELAEQPLLDLLKASLHWKHLLLILDNFEQVIDAAVYVADLLSACSLLKVIVTSRAALHVRGEQEFAVPPLAVPDPKNLPDLVAISQYEAVALFIARAQAVKPEFQMSNANAPAIAEICVRLDGIPLAIELATARIKLLPPHALLARLSQRLAILTSGTRDVPERQQTLRNTITWSYQLLDADVQRLFRRLSVFVGGCTLQAIEAIGATLDGEAGRVFEDVASLLDQSLLQQTESDGEEPRLMILESLREYGLEALAANEEMEVTRQAHALYYLALAEESEPELAGPRQAMWLERLEREHDNVRVALWWLLEHGEINQSKREMALRLAGALWRFWEVRGHWSEGWNFLERALAGSKGVVVPVQVKALKAAAHLAYVRGDNDRAEELFEECLAGCRELGDTVGIALSLRLLGSIAWRRGNFAVARSLTEESLVLFRSVGDKEGSAWSLCNLGLTVSHQGEYTRAISLTEEALALFRALGNIEGIAWSLFNLAEMHFMSQDDPANVHTLLEESLALCRGVGHKEGIAAALGLFGEVVLQQGDAVKARLLLEESMVLCREIGNRNIAWLLIVLGRVEALEGDHTAAHALYEESLAIGREMGDDLIIAFYLEGLADVATVQGESLWAARLWGLAETLREAMGAPIPPVYCADYERSVAAVHTRLGEKAFVAAWAEGRSMTAEQAVAAQGQAILSQPGPTELLSTSPAKAPTANPDGLTPREMDVLVLLAQGLTSTQIAEQLVIGVVTVNFHVRSIYSKLGVTSRSSATRYALEHHLV